MPHPTFTPFYKLSRVKHEMSFTMIWTELQVPIMEVDPTNQELTTIP